MSSEASRVYSIYIYILFLPQPRCDEGKCMRNGGVRRILSQRVRMIVEYPDFFFYFSASGIVQNRRIRVAPAPFFYTHKRTHTERGAYFFFLFPRLPSFVSVTRSNTSKCLADQFVDLSERLTMKMICPSSLRVLLALQPVCFLEASNINIMIWRMGGSRLLAVVATLVIRLSREIIQVRLCFSFLVLFLQKKVKLDTIFYFISYLMGEQGNFPSVRGRRRGRWSSRTPCMC